MLLDTDTFNFAPSIAILSAVLPMFTRDPPKMIMHVVSIYKLLAEKNLPDIYLSKRYNCVISAGLIMALRVVGLLFKDSALEKCTSAILVRLSLSGQTSRIFVRPRHLQIQNI